MWKSNLRNAPSTNQASRKTANCDFSNKPRVSRSAARAEQLCRHHRPIVTDVNTDAQFVVVSEQIPLVTGDSIHSLTILSATLLASSSLNEGSYLEAMFFAQPLQTMPPSSSQSPGPSPSEEKYLK